ncbi:MAG: molybdopterin-dependent oxidoreductase [Colwellia sp.]|nr:molybdopterin-dependent oxidoreductase [Colwellia sp.]
MHKISIEENNMIEKGSKTHTPFPEIKTILNNGERLKILNYKKPLNEIVWGKYVGTEIDFERIDSLLIQSDKWFIRNHFDIPSIDINNWRLVLDGSFNNTVSLTLGDVKSFKTVSHVVTIECNGNSALTGDVAKNVSFFRLISKGMNYLVNPMKWKELFDFFNRGSRNGLMSTAEFKGVRLLDLLDKYPAKEGTKELVFRGLDKGVDTLSGYLTFKKIYYERSLSIEKIKQCDPIVCFEMNGEPLLPRHGSPLRLIVPGIQGADHVKWLTRITATADIFNGHFMKNYYQNEMEVVENGKKIKKTYHARTQKVKSIVIRVLKRGKTITVFGVAWCGKYPVKEVLVSGDSGKNWSNASFLHPPSPYRWVFWETVFENCRSGPTTFLSQAVDTDGNKQPLERERDVFYGNNAVIPAEVNIP